VTSLAEPMAAAVRALRANKMRSGLTTLGIIIGVAAVIIVVSLVQGLKRSVLKDIEKAGSQTVIVRPLFPVDVPFDEYSKVRNKDLTLEDLRALQHAVPAITSVTPIFMSNTDVKAGGKSANTRVLMTDETWLEQNGVNLSAGRNFVPSDIRLGSKVAIVGTRVLEKLGIKGSPLGRILSTPTLSLEVIGVLEEQGASLGQDQDDMVAIPIATGLAQLPDSQRRQLIFQARIDPRLSVDDGADMIKDALRRIKGVKAKEREGFLVRSLKQVSGIIGNITATITAVAGGMVSIALLVAASAS